ncbi:MAG: DUF4444 domain-containing protein [Litoreibacter sp.]
MTYHLSLPPLFSSLEVTGDPMQEAVSYARKGCESGLVCYATSTQNLHAAIVFAPDVPIADAVAMLPLCAVGFQNALGALAPPEVALHLTWDGHLKVNGGLCGGFRMAASTAVATDAADWLVIGLKVPLWPASDNPGETPYETALYAEGCAGVDAIALLEAWVRHTLVWINRWTEDGVAALHSEWSALAVDSIGKFMTINEKNGSFIGVDERFGALIRDEDTTHLIPMTTLVETPK